MPEGQRAQRRVVIFGGAGRSRWITHPQPQQRGGTPACGDLGVASPASGPNYARMYTVDVRTCVVEGVKICCLLLLLVMVGSSPDESHATMRIA